MKPTQEQLDTFFTVLRWLEEKTKRDEPYAVVYLQALNEVREQTPLDISEL